jgi:hypothetical protein
MNINLLVEQAMVGKHNNIPDNKFDKKQLSRGIEVEKEHTEDPNISKRIAKDHLSELPDYYTRLDRMEKEGEKALKKKI